MIHKRKHCVALAKRIALTRDGYQCVRCGRSKEHGYKIDGSHIFSEGGHPAISAEPDNIKALCSRCHTLAGDSWHEDPANQDWFDKKYPGRRERLRKLERELQGKQDWEQVYQRLSEILKTIT